MQRILQLPPLEQGQRIPRVLRQTLVLRTGERRNCLARQDAHQRSLRMVPLYLSAVDVQGPDNVSHLVNEPWIRAKQVFFPSLQQHGQQTTSHS